MREAAGVTWLHPTKTRWVCVEHPDRVIKRIRLLRFMGNRYRVEVAGLWMGNTFSLVEAKLRAAS
jgi:hypothetical protein